MGDGTTDVKTGAVGEGEEDIESIASKVVPPPKIPDVELFIDGFGFMPIKPEDSREAIAKERIKTKKPKSKDAENLKSPCSDLSTNLNIVRRYTWKTKNRMTVQVISYGATITSISVPDRKGVPEDVVAGFETLEEYLNPRNPYFGATIGRCANTIREATMVVKPSGRMYMLSNNSGAHHYHGGFKGFDKVNWQSYVSGEKVIMSHVSQRFDEGYPGSVLAQVSFECKCDNTIKIEMKCTTSEPTIVNMSIAPYFNLAGHYAGLENMLDHIFTLNGDKYTPIDDYGLVTGEKKVVGGTAYDFRVPRVLRTMLPKIPMGGYNINFCVTRGTEQELAFQARSLHPKSGRVLEVYSNQPGMQFYTGNDLPNPDFMVEEEPGDKEDDESKESADDEYDEGTEGTSTTQSGEHEEPVADEGEKPKVYIPLPGKGGTHYKRHGLFCLMPQNYPDAVNQRGFPSAVLNPGETYIHSIEYKFGILLGKYV